MTQIGHRATSLVTQSLFSREDTGPRYGKRGASRTLAAAIKLPSWVLQSERGGRALTASRVFPLVIILVCAPFTVGAQFGGVPGLPGGPPSQVPGGLGGPTARPPPA